MSHKNYLYLENKKYLFFILIVLIGSFNYGIFAISDINLINKLENINLYMPKIVYMIITMCGLYLLSSNKFISPYLNYSCPYDVLKNHIPDNTNYNIKVNVPPNVLVIYWSDDKNNIALNNENEPWDSFKNYNNSGILRSNEYGNVNLKINKSKSNKMIYYKYYNNLGFLSSLKRIYVK